MTGLPWTSNIQETSSSPMSINKKVLDSFAAKNVYARLSLWTEKKITKCSENHEESRAAPNRCLGRCDGPCQFSLEGYRGTHVRGLREDGQRSVDKWGIKTTIHRHLEYIPNQRPMMSKTTIGCTSLIS